MINITQPDWIKSIVALRPGLLFTLWVLGGLLLLAPESVTDKLGLTCTLTTHRAWWGGATLVLLALWTARMLPVTARWFRAGRARRSALHSLTTLSYEERLVLIYCHTYGQQTVTLEVGHRAAAALVFKGLLEPARGVGDTLHWPYTIPDFVWRHLQRDSASVMGELSADDPGLSAALESLDEHIRRYDTLQF